MRKYWDLDINFAERVLPPRPINNACGRQALILENRRENNFPFDLYSYIRYEILLIARLAAVCKSSHKILHISYSHLLFVTL